MFDGWLQTSAPARFIFNVSCVLLLLCVPSRALALGKTERILLAFALPCAWTVMLFFARSVFNFYSACRAYATSMTSVRPSVRLLVVDCDRTVIVIIIIIININTLMYFDILILLLNEFVCYKIN